MTTELVPAPEVLPAAPEPRKRTTGVQILAALDETGVIPEQIRKINEWVREQDPSSKKFQPVAFATVFSKLVGALVALEQLDVKRNRVERPSQHLHLEMFKRTQAEIDAMPEAARDIFVQLATEIAAAENAGAR